MVPRAATKKSGKEIAEEMMQQPVEDDDDILRPPDSSSDEGDNPADIKHTVFKRASEEPKPENLKTGSTAARGRKVGKGTANSSNGSNRRNARNTLSPISSHSSSSPGRKSQEEPVKLGGHMADAYGRVTVNNKRKKATSSQDVGLSQKSKKLGLSQGMLISTYCISPNTDTNIFILKNRLLGSSNPRPVSKSKAHRSPTQRICGHLNMQIFLWLAARPQLQGQ
jgi:hypothetical protein